MQSRKQQGAGRSLRFVPKQASELEMQYLVEREKREVVVGGGKEECPFETCDCWMAGVWSRRPITEVPS